VRRKQRLDFVPRVLRVKVKRRPLELFCLFKKSLVSYRTVTTHCTFYNTPFKSVAVTSNDITTVDNHSSTVIFSQLCLVLTLFLYHCCNAVVVTAASIKVTTTGVVIRFGATQLTRWRKATLGVRDTSIRYTVFCYHINWQLLGNFKPASTSRPYHDRPTIFRQRYTTS
jgi:hypothetical protein